MRILVIASFLGSVSPSGALQAQSLGEHPAVTEAIHLVEVWLDAERAYEGAPGLSAALVHDQDLLWAGASGYADLEAGIPATTSTAYSICSISKLFTSIGVMQLRDAGRLGLDDPVADLLPWYSIAETYPGSPPVTLRGMLTHSSGLPRESDFPYWIAPFDFPTHEQVVERLSSQEMLYPSDLYYQYSNLGLTLAGEIVSVVSGLPYSDYVRQNVLDPIGLGDTWPEFGDYPDPARVAAGYTATRRSGKRERLPTFRVEGIAPAAGFASTAEDLARFASWQYRALAGVGDGVLSGNTLREMQRVHWLDGDWETARGLGFGVYRSEGETYVGHSGSCPGYETALRLHTPSRTAAVVMINANGQPDPGTLAVQAIRILAPAVDEALADQAAIEAGFLPRDYVHSELPAGFDRFLGSYDESPWGGESAIVPWEGGLAVLVLPTLYPADDLNLLEHVGGNRFRRVREDGALGEEYEFVEDAEGQVTGMRYHSNTYPRIR